MTCFQQDQTEFTERILHYPSYEVMVKLIDSTTTTGGLKVLSELDTNAYEKGIKVSDKDFEKLNIEKDAFHGEWNYTIKHHT